ncbi:MAG: PQQ-binding-like beta-propeller repeat protein [Pirellulales bacterium]
MWKLALPLFRGPLRLRAVRSLAGLKVPSIAVGLLSIGMASLGSMERELVAKDTTQDVQKIAETSGVQGGFVVHVGIQDGKLTQALKRNASFQVQGLDRDAKTVAQVRERLVREGVYGDIAVERWIGNELPYIDNLVNLMVIDDSQEVSKVEVMRVLVPNGVALRRKPDGTWDKWIKPRPNNIDEWSHYLHDATGNAVAHDDVVAPPRHLQWVGSPRYSRHHDRMASMSALVSTNGRMFYIMDEGSRISIQLPPKWKLIARDAFNGTVLWKQDIPTWQSHLWPLKSGPTQLSRRLVSNDDNVFVTLGYDAPLTALNAATGEVVKTFLGTDGTEEVITTNGLLFLVVRKGKAELADYAPMNPTVGDQAVARGMFWNEEPRLVMAIEASTGKQLWAKQTRISPLTLAADGTNVYFHDGEHVVAADQKTGTPAWSSESVTRRNQFTFNFGPRLLVHQDVVLFAGGDGKMVSLSAGDGKLLWSADHPNSGYQSPQDLMVVNGLVWCAPTTTGKDSGVFTGRDPKTGEVKKEFPPDIDTYWFHHRCYIAKATDNFIIPSRTGIEFVDTEDQHWDIHHWVRGGCLYGVMPCNGLTYAPPHNCACYPEAKLFGFNALAPLAPTRPIPGEVSEEGRLEKGPRYSDALAAQETANKGDWPTYRHDAGRSGHASQSVDPKLGSQWEVNLGGRLTAPVISGGLVYVAQTDAHTLHAIEEGSGKTRWTFTAGGRIDSPPSIAHGRVVFGGADGWVYCLESQSGDLAWKYRAAPLDRRTMAYEQLESLWPVHGSVLLRDGVVYCVSGRSNFLDGGLRLLRLKLASGEKLSENIMDETNPDTGRNMQEKLQILQMPVGLPDILSSDDKFLYMKSQKFDFEGKRLQIGPNSGDFVKQASVQRGEGEHIFAPMGFLDDTWFHRSYWVLGQSFAGGHGGYYQAGRFAPSGRLMVKGNGYVFAYGRKPEYFRWTTTLEHHLYAADPSPPEIPEDFGKGAAPASGVYAQFPKSPNLNPLGKPITVEAWITATNPNGVIVARGGPAEGFALALDAGRPVFLVRSSGDLATVTGPRRIVGGWHHVVGVIDASKAMRLYVDGVKVAEGKSNGLLTKDPAQGLEIGADAGSSVGNYETPNAFTGIIDEVRLFFDTPSDEAVEERYRTGGEMLQDPHLVVTFDDGTARDWSTYRQDGTLEGGTRVEGKFGMAVRFTAKKGADTAKSKSEDENLNPKDAKNKKATGNTLIKPKWSEDIPVYARAMALAGETLFVAGPLDTIDEEETFKKLSDKDEDVQRELQQQDEALDGKIGGLLLSINSFSGKVENRIELGTFPTWDGMASANGQIYLTTLDGRILCFGK